MHHIIRYIVCNVLIKIPRGRLRKRLIDLVEKILKVRESIKML